MISWKTTLFGAIACILPVVNPLVSIIPSPWDKVISAIFGVVAFYYAKDKNVTGASK